MTTPTHDDQGRELMPEPEFHRIHMLSPDEFDRLDQATKERYWATLTYHEGQRQADIDVESIQTGSGLSYQEKLAEWRRTSGR